MLSQPIAPLSQGESSFSNLREGNSLPSAPELLGDGSLQRALCFLGLSLGSKSICPAPYSLQGVTDTHFLFVVYIPRWQVRKLRLRR